MICQLLRKMVLKGNIGYINAISIEYGTINNNMLDE